MNINILTIFPEIFDALNFGVVSRSLDKDLLKVKTFDIRKNSINKHDQVDSKPYGGGEGMVMMAEPIISTLKEIDNKNLDFFLKVVVKISFKVPVIVM